MRKALIFAALLALSGLGQGSAQAGILDRLFNREEPQQYQTYDASAQTYYDQSSGQYYTYEYQQVESRPNLFQQLWEMEQRKNAWLKRTLFGR